MKLTKALSVRDQITKQALYSALSDVLSDDQRTIDRIAEAFKKGEQTWRPHLISMVGRRQAGAMFDALEQDVPQPR